MRHVGALALGVLFLAQPLAAAPGEKVIALPDNADTIVIPAASTLHLRGVTKDYTVNFDGPVEISGTYYYGADVYDDGGSSTDPVLYLVLDKASLARLPRFGTRGQPGELYLTNEKDFAKAVIPPDDMKAALRRGGKYAAGKADIWVDKFQASIECDAPNFTAHFLSVAHAPLRVALANAPDVGC